MRELDDPVTKGWKVGARGFSGLREKTVRRHAGERVCFEAPRISCVVDDEIDSRVVSEPKGPVSAESKRTEAL